MTHLEKALSMLQGASDAELKKLYIKRADISGEKPSVVADETSDEDMQLLEQSLEE